jgi:hypothetical protein
VLPKYEDLNNYLSSLYGIFSKFLITYALKILEIHLTKQICIHFFFLSFGEYAFSNFPIEINHRICTKVMNTPLTFGINFFNHKLALLEHNFFAKPIICGAIEPRVLSKTLPNAT